MNNILQIILLVFISIFIMSSSCDRGTEGCTDPIACNYDDSVAVDDGSCWFSFEGCDCDDPSGSKVDCLGVCDQNINNNPPVDSDGKCCTRLNEQCNEIVIGGCMDDLNCNYNANATHNDGSCANDLSSFGSPYFDGRDCNEVCKGESIVDACNLCIGGDTELGQCWQIKIKSIATFKLQNGILMGSDTNSIFIGVSDNALDGYNNNIVNESQINCQLDYLDDFEPPKPTFTNNNNYIRYFIPHTDINEWDEWGSKIDLDVEYLFDSDIRSTDYSSLFPNNNGMDWFTVIEPNLTDTIIVDENGNFNKHQTFIDSIKFEVIHLEGIQCSEIKFILDRDKGEKTGGIEIVDPESGIEVNTDKEINITINLLNICVGQDIDTFCPDF